jgi:hypothetical protein
VARLGVAEGTTVCLTEAPDGGCLPTPSVPTLASPMAAARRIMQRRRNVLRELARQRSAPVRVSRKRRPRREAGAVSLADVGAMQ